MNRRRNKRTVLKISVLIKSLDPRLFFAEPGATLDVSPCGCQVRAPRPFVNGTWIGLQLKTENRLIAARVVRSIPAGSDTWRIGLELFRPEQAWG